MKGTIGEYADAKGLQRNLVKVQEIDGGGRSEPFDERTQSVKVCLDEAHRWGFNEDDGQLRPGDVIESHDVAKGEGWSMWFEEDL